eukprot:1189668-Prorocentrum_minimum.AAC.3
MLQPGMVVLIPRHLFLHSRGGEIELPYAPGSRKFFGGMQVTKYAPIYPTSTLSLHVRIWMFLRVHVQANAIRCLANIWGEN